MNKWLIGIVIIIGISISAFTVYYIIALISMVALFGEPHAVNVNSTSYSTVQEKVLHYKQYYKLPTNVLDIEYDISGATGGVFKTDWYCSIAVKISPQDTQKWVGHLTKITRKQINETDAGALLEIDKYKPGERVPEDSNLHSMPRLNSPTWRHASPAEYYKTGMDYLILHRKEGIIFFTYTSI